MNRNDLFRLLAQEQITPNRALGQNFLVDEGVTQAILDMAQPAGQSVLEIGPGLGALTEGLTERAGRVVAVEKDKTLAQLLKARLKSHRLTVIAADFLDVDVPAAMGNAPYIALGNLPYCVTTPLSEKLLALLPAAATLMVQAEAAPRFFAEPGDRVYGPLAVLSRGFYHEEGGVDVPPGAFYPAPTINSRVLRLVQIPRQDGTEPHGLMRFLKRAFAQRRKTLYNVLGRPEKLEEALLALHLPQNVRAEALNPEELIALYRYLDAV